MKTQLLKLTDIVIDAGTQARAQIDEMTVARYAEAMADASNKFPAVVVFHDGNRYLLADGFHRFHAATRKEREDIEAEIHTGTRLDALRYAVGCNDKHGWPRTNADKRRAVELAIAEWSSLSDRELARICAVSHQFVSNMRPTQLSTVDSSRTGKDGKTRKLPAKKQATPKPIGEQINEAHRRGQELEEKPRIKTADELLQEQAAELQNQINFMADMQRCWKLASPEQKKSFLEWVANDRKQNPF